MNLRPTPSEERWLALARRLRRSPRVAFFAERTGGWRTANLPSRCTFFALGLVAAGMIAIIVDRLGPTGAVAIAGIVSLAIAEWLIVNRRHFGSEGKRNLCSSLRQIRGAGPQRGTVYLDAHR